MMESRTLLFLFGTFALASCKAFLPEIGLGIAKVATGKFIEEEPHGAPFISNFIQEGTNVFYKPHFTMTSHLERPHAVILENGECNKTPLMPASVLTPAVMDEPLKIVETVLPSTELELPHLKEVIEINPLTPEVVMPLPFAPAPVFAPEPVVFPEAPIFPSIPEPILPELPLPVHDVLVPELPTLPMPIVPLPMPAVVEEPIMIPEAPVLPPFAMPELPTLTVVEAQPVPMPELPIPVEPTAVMIEEPVFIPEAPLLPPLKMPELPTIIEANPITTMIEEPVVIPEAPELPTLIMPEIPAPAIFEEPSPMPIVPALEPVVIPEAPVLPPFVMPELPNPPVYEVMPELPVPFEPASVVVEEPAVIPEAPLLPPMALPELPSPVVLEEKIPIEEVKIEMPALIPTGPFFPQQPCGYPFAPCPVEPYPHPIAVPPLYIPLADVPHPPMVPFMPSMPQLPIHSERIEINKVIMSSVPSSLAFPTECAQGIIAERILPHMTGHGIIAAPELINPVPAPYIRL